MFPPYARGWTLSSRSRLGVTIVSPACAGMDPCSLNTYWPPGGFPACAGMDLLRVGAVRLTSSFPRMRGDGTPSCAKTRPS